MGNINMNEFEAYEEVRISGETNMWDTNMVSMLSGLPKDKILVIMNDYTKLRERYEMKQTKDNLSDVVSNKNGRLKE
jgi:hypothetical protein